MSKTDIVQRLRDTSGRHINGLYDHEAADEIEQLRTRIDLLQSWEADASARAEGLSIHLRAVLEIAHTWQPDYATEMDRATLALAAAECGFKAP